MYYVLIRYKHITKKIKHDIKIFVKCLVVTLGVTLIRWTGSHFSILHLSHKISLRQTLTSFKRKVDSGVLPVQLYLCLCQVEHRNGKGKNKSDHSRLFTRKHNKINEQPSTCRFRENLFVSTYVLVQWKGSEFFYTCQDTNCDNEHSHDKNRSQDNYPSYELKIYRYLGRRIIKS